jgi:hypothetical protein
MILQYLWRSSLLEFLSSKSVHVPSIESALLFLLLNSTSVLLAFFFLVLNYSKKTTSHFYNLNFFISTASSPIDSFEDISPEHHALTPLTCVLSNKTCTSLRYFGPSFLNLVWLHLMPLLGSLHL